VIELKGPLKVFASSITATDSETQATQKLYSYLAKYVEFNGKLGEVRLPFAHILTACTPTACCSARCDPPCYDLIRLCVCVGRVLSVSRLRLHRIRRQPSRPGRAGACAPVPLQALHAVPVSCLRVFTV
jgi:hypothetical protein